MKKPNKNWIYRITILFLIILSLLIPISALEILDSDGDIGDANYLIIRDSLNTWDTLKLNIQDINPFTVIGGSVCSAYPDISGDFTKRTTHTDDATYTNYNHDGVAFQLFQVTNAQNICGAYWCYIGEYQIERGETVKILDAPYLVDIEYHYDIYYCDDSPDEQSCHDTDSSINGFVKGTVTVISGDGEQSYDDTCETASLLLERYCIENTVSSTLITCVGQCSNGQCIETYDNELYCYSENDCDPGEYCDVSGQCLNIGQIPPEAPIPEPIPIPGVVCNPPYIQYGADCCLDSNSNNICDIDEQDVDNKDNNNMLWYFLFGFIVVIIILILLFK